ncbi:MAG: cytochrome o ubiquinol oxidase subunit III [Gammaproteobacteria bacterium RIFCSPHIGHO2_12_FULL_42_13]|nr:MAG: cytochrome o ubiquinol oxidase subunit III [Gammaproteobacteria bacterium RIFCSPHIGHO2_12_FULL_42_13]
MTHTLANGNHHNTDTIDVFGFWIYILSDCILFATIFITYAVLHTHVYGGPEIKELSNTSYILIETIALLVSSFTYGLAVLTLYNHEIKKTLALLVVTFLFGLLFISMEINEFISLCLDGHNWQSSAALSAFFTLVGTHGLHVTLGLIWMLVLMMQLLLFGITPIMRKRLTYLGLFWAFLDIIWIFVFTIVYLMGKISHV